jgi:hypothetical protein
MAHLDVSKRGGYGVLDSLMLFLLIGLLLQLLKHF